MMPAGGRKAVLISDFRTRIERAGIQPGVVMELMLFQFLRHGVLLTCDFGKEVRFEGLERWHRLCIADRECAWS